MLCEYKHLLCHREEKNEQSSGQLKKTAPARSNAVLPIQNPGTRFGGWVPDHWGHAINLPYTCVVWMLVCRICLCSVVSASPWVFLEFVWCAWHRVVSCSCDLYTDRKMEASRCICTQVPCAQLSDTIINILEARTNRTNCA